MIDASIQVGTPFAAAHTDVPVGPHHLSGACKVVASILSSVGDKWTVLTVMALAGGPRRFNELKRMVGGVSQRMLTLTLRRLERDGLVQRTVYATVPPRVDYELTQLGDSLRTPIDALGAWASAHIPAIEHARAAFDQRHPAAPEDAARTWPAVHHAVARAAAGVA